MNTTHRFEAAIKKLYEAFHNNMLNPECCKQCAVGNILDNTESWKYFSDDHGSTNLNYIGRFHQNIGRRFNGYTPLELLTIESIFLKACGYAIPLHYKNEKPKNTTDKEILFKGLTAVVSHLCRIDGIANIMDYSKLFEYEKDKAKYELAI
ncbi:MAG: Na(+)-translocating NADH-quinone reductase subunit F [Winogradskyella sp.]|uniref:Na(+)-translocating NADH-quinone reductase subunit F n=1 Tax=Winogradskyella sp. TaxID=1883156 RepID=UPI000F3B8904|nr:Na(+)-translocating NADH-quinone reductase subunit F [Winogradskyella sp.]RNC84062.1 MAG: Na(+)-translocating NADH-quinone reductase subunit F [Winogradskyella sp.]